MTLVYENLHSLESKLLKGRNVDVEYTSSTTTPLPPHFFSKNRRSLRLRLLEQQVAYLSQILWPSSTTALSRQFCSLFLQLSDFTLRLHRLYHRKACSLSANEHIFVNLAACDADMLFSIAMSSCSRAICLSTVSAV